MKLQILFIITLTCGCTAFNRVKPQPEQAARKPAFSSFYGEIDPRASFSCENFFYLLKNSQVVSIDQALQMVDKANPYYLKRHSLVYLSRSLHEASFQNPRALAYGYDAKMVMSFNGDKTQEGFERLELMCFDNKTHTFNFREVTFPKEATKPLDDLSPKEKTQNFVISPVNGSPSRRCTACHMQAARPIWDTYPFWPGVYGSQDDFPQTYMRAKPFNNNVQERFFRDVNQIEITNWIQFHQTRPTKERYKWIGGYDGQMSDDQPNFHFNLLIQELNHQRITQILINKISLLKKERFQIADALFCNQFASETFLSSEGKNFDFPLVKKSFSPITKKIISADIDTLETRHNIMSAVLGKAGIAPRIDDPDAQKLNEIFNQWYSIPLSTLQNASSISELVDPAEIAVVAKLEPILARYNIDIHNWSTKFEGDGYMFNDGALNPLAIVRLVDGPFIDRAFKDDKELLAMIRLQRKPFEKYDSRPLCQKISQKLSKEMSL